MDIEKEDIIAAIKDKAEKNEWTESDLGRIYNILIRHSTDTTKEEQVDEETIKKYLVRGWWLSELLEGVDYTKETCPLCIKNVVHQTDQEADSDATKVYHRNIDDSK